MNGERIIVTRAAEQANKVSSMLRSRGAVPVEFPTITIAPPEDVAALQKTLANANTFDWLVLTSSNTVRAIRSYLPKDLAGVQIASVGPRTAKTIRRELNADVDLVPEEHKAEGLAEALIALGVQDKKILIPQSDIARNVLAEILAKAGADVTTVTAYRTEVGGSGGAEIDDVQNAEAVIFTSSSTVRGFVERVGGPMPDLLAACIGPITADTARELGFRRIIMPEGDYTIPAIIELLEEYHAREES